MGLTEQAGLDKPPWPPATPKLGGELLGIRLLS